MKEARSAGQRPMEEDSTKALGNVIRVDDERI
jgi:hypothetical protein